MRSSTILSVLGLSYGAGVASAYPSSHDHTPLISRQQIPPLPANYETLPALEKQGLIWDRIKLTANSSQEWISGLETAFLMTTLPPRPPFDRINDEMVEGRKKFIRNRGAHALVKLVPTGNNPDVYTGIWNEGANNGIIRLTTLEEPPTKPKAGDKVIAPGGVMKLWRDGMPSTNLFFIYSLEGQESWNFFEHPCSNHLAPPESLKTKAGKLLNQRVSHYSEMTGNSDIAKFNTAGAQVANPKAPFQIWLAPSAEVKSNSPILEPATAGANFASAFSVIPSGTTLYHVYAIPEPVQPYNPATVYNPQALPGAAHIADVVTTSEFLSSVYGDAKLHFKHTSFDDDLTLRPDWKSIVRGARS
ncbi:hypothetical protein HDU85_001004 [Gaertneriomyces sp. JEL0708]|nr:hypothetical protein HDU85_001004 [Gaertneriomyces sp. JEL0708]